MPPVCLLPATLLNYKTISGAREKGEGWVHIKFTYIHINKITNYQIIRQKMKAGCLNLSKYLLKRILTS